MADPRSYRPAAGEIPTVPGVYRFLDGEGRVLYVGKAVNLRQRLSSYFAAPATLHPRTRTMVFAAESVQWTIVGTEAEALQLEYTWIKEFQPRFNVMFRDDKSYPYLAITVSDAIPRVFVTRGAKRRGTRYFGPFSRAWAIRDTLDQLLKVFPMRSCSAATFNRAQRENRPCLLGFIGKCAAPCVGRVDEAEHRAIVDDFIAFMGGTSASFVKNLERLMLEAAGRQEYERAGQLRDNMAALSSVLEKSAVVLPDSADADVLAVEPDELELAVHAFYVRGGRIRGEQSWLVQRDVELSGPEFLDQLLEQVYRDAAPDSIPPEVLLPELPASLSVVEKLLSDRRGARVRVRVPRRGEKRALLDTAERNAKQSLTVHKLRRAGDLNARSRALTDIQEALGLDEAPLRIECYDISHTQGTNVVGSMVVFEDGTPRTSEYRKFGVSGEAARDDTASMYDVLSRRFTRYLESLAEGAEAAASGELDPAEPVRRNRFSYAPGLVIVDGGPPQVAAGRRALDDLGLAHIPVVGLAKRLEELWVPDDDFPVILPRQSEALYLLQHVRDEAHRFAITFHRQKRAASMTRGALDAIPGLGAAKQAALLKALGSVKRIRAANLDELTAVPGIGPALAARIVAGLAAAPDAADPAADSVDPGSAGGSAGAGSAAAADPVAGPGSAGPVADAGAAGPAGTDPGAARR